MWFSSPGRGKSLSWFFKRLVAACAPVLMTSTTKKNNFSFILVGRQANDNLGHKSTWHAVSTQAELVEGFGWMHFPSGTTSPLISSKQSTLLCLNPFPH